MPKQNKGIPSTQDHLLVRAVRDHVIILRTGEMAAVIEVEGIDLTRLPDDAQKRLTAQYENFLLTLRFPYQQVVARKRQRLEEYLAYADAEAQKREQEGNKAYAQTKSQLGEFHGDDSVQESRTASGSTLGVSARVTLPSLRPSEFRAKVRMFRAAFTSRSITRPQLGHLCTRTSNFFLTIEPQLEQSWEVLRGLTFTS